MPPPRSFFSPMRLDTLRAYCLAKPGATEDQPFGPDNLVFKVAGKMFAITDLERVPVEVGLKCDPERAVELREAYDGIYPGPYLNKKHWNYVRLGGDVPDALVRELVDHSYDLVVAGLPRAARERLVAGG
ncbi:MAG TPA: MmcQ/YjbR family DNA-binding protein [Rubricoccaceae bacterium]|nr:MmcQ/YjbR family DNA-binding protein [Rubricoccaceae bacterium]